MDNNKYRIFWAVAMVIITVLMVLMLFELLASQVSALLPSIP